jgi:hypothetical protein
MKFILLSSIPSSDRATVAHLYKVQHENEALTKYVPSVVPELRCRKFDVICVCTTYFIILIASKHWSLNSPSLAVSDFHTCAVVT